MCRRRAIVLLSAWGMLIGQASAMDGGHDRRPAAPFESGLRRAIVSPGSSPERLRLSDRMAHYNVPGLSVAIIRDCRVAFTRGYGVRERGLRKRDRDTIKTNTIFQAASISKPVASIAALRLVEQGKLGLDADITAAMRGWSLPDSELTRKHPVTLRLLLSHGAGLTVHGFGGYPAGQRVPSIQQILDGKPPANSEAVRVDQVPGSKFKYSGGGYTVAQLLMTEATKQSFPQLMRDLVLAPAGMGSSTYEQPLPSKMAARAASGHRPDGTVLPGRWHTYPEMAAAGLWTTPADLARFAIDIMRSDRGDGNAIIRQKTAKEILRKQMGDWGLGVEVSGSDKAKAFKHGGANEGYRAYFIAFPKTCQGAAVMTNSDNGNALIRETLRSLADTEKWPDPLKSEVRVTVPLALEARARIVGSYRLVEDPSATIEVAEDPRGHLALSVAGSPGIELTASSATQLFSADDGRVVEVSSEDAGAARTLTIEMPGGVRYKAERIRSQNQGNL